MSYQDYLQQIQQLMAMGVYYPPLTVAALPMQPVFLPMQKNFLTSSSVPICETISIDTESDKDTDDTDERTLFCANLHEKVSEELLCELFMQAGPIQKVYIPKDNTGKNRSFGFVTYKYRSCPQYAMRLFQGLSLFGRTVCIKFQGNHNFHIR